MERKVELTKKEFKHLLAELATKMCVEADEHQVDGRMIALILAMYGAELVAALFNEEKLEVEKDG